MKNVLLIISMMMVLTVSGCSNVEQEQLAGPPVLVNEQFSIHKVTHEGKSYKILVHPKGITKLD